MKRSLLLSLYGICLSLLIASYQNCSVSVTHTGRASSQKAIFQYESGGNTYDGKPAPGEYVRRYDRDCTGRMGASAIGKIEVADNGAAVKSDICHDINYDFNFSDSRLDFSIYNRDVIGFNSAIFERMTSESAKVDYTDLWCTHQQQDFGIDIVVRTVNGRLEATLYKGDELRSSEPELHKSMPLPVSKSQTSKVLTFSSTEYLLNASVELASQVNGKYNGRIQVKFGEQDLDLPVSCRLMDAAPAVFAQPSHVMAIYQLNGVSGEEVDGSMVLDSSSRANHSVLKNSDGLGTHYNRDFQGGGLWMDGRDSYIDISSLGPQLAGDFTLTMKIKPEPGIADDRVAFAITDTAGNNVLKVGSGLCSGTGDRTQLSLQLRSTCANSGMEITDGAWHSVTVTASGDQVRLYADGIEVAQGALRNPLAPTDTWSIGRDLDGSIANDFWFGMLGEIVFWNSALSVTELK